MSKNGNTLGILDLGYRSTLFYIHTLNTEFNKIEKDYNTFPFILYNTNFNLINPYLPDTFEKLLPQLSEYIHYMEKLPINRLLIPNITIHEALDKLDISLPLLHPLTLSINYLKKNNINQVVVFGSKYTMTSTYISNYFSSEGIRVNSPLQKDIEFIDALRQKIYSNSETAIDLDNYTKLLEKYSKQALVLIACTELSILNMPTEGLDLARLQIKEAIATFKRI